MIWGGWEPTPPQPGSLDDAMARGFDPTTASLPDNTDPLGDEWQHALDRSLEIVAHLKADDCGVPGCGVIRCDRCDERMVCVGPEPRACGTTCVDCDCSCDTCLMVREEMRAELQCKIERESYGNA